MITELLNINLTEVLGLDSMPKEEKDTLVAQMLDTIESRINLEALSLLSEEDKKELDKVLDSSGDLVGFLREKIPNFDVLVAETVANFKKEVLDLRRAVTTA